MGEIILKILIHGFLFIGFLVLQMSCKGPLIDGKKILGIGDCQARIPEIPTVFELNSTCVREHKSVVESFNSRRWEESHYGVFIGSYKTKGLKSDLRALSGEGLFTLGYSKCEDDSPKGSAYFHWFFEFSRAKSAIEEDQKATDTIYRCEFAEADLGKAQDCVPWIHKLIKDEKGNILVDSWQSLLVDSYSKNNTLLCSATLIAQQL